MSYEALALKWRPQSFSELTGQEAARVTLSNALKSGRLHPVCLFTGPRGTGKTSAARILAKTLRCENKPAPDVPCCACPECLSIQKGQSLNVIEIDGASNNGVEAVRELRDGLNYMPSAGSQKVYIIDEVHMLSTSAFNALLKTLEEPPPHIQFIMATTEAHKIPLTVVSRCQKFDFHLIPARLLKERLEKVSQGEKILIDDKTLWLLAKRAGGSLRDGQSLLDQISVFCNGKITYEKAASILCLSNPDLIEKALKALCEKDEEKMLSVIEERRSAGSDPKLFLENIIEGLRDLLILKQNPENKPPLVHRPKRETEEMKAFSKETGAEDLHFLFDIALKGERDQALCHDGDLALDVLLLKLAGAPRLERLVPFNPLLPLEETSGAPLPRAADAEGKEKPGSLSTQNKKEGKPSPAAAAAADQEKEEQAEKAKTSPVAKGAGKEEGGEKTKPRLSKEASREAKGTEGIEEVKEAEGTKGTEGTEETKKAKENEGIKGTEGTEGTEGTKEIKETEGTKETKGTKGTEEIKETEEAKKAKENEGIKGTEEIKETEETKGTEGTKEIKETEEAKGTKETEEAKGTEETKETEEIKETKETKGTEEAKETKEAKGTEEAEEGENPEETWLDFMKVLKSENSFLEAAVSRCSLQGKRGTRFLLRLPDLSYARSKVMEKAQFLEDRLNFFLKAKDRRFTIHFQDMFSDENEGAASAAGGDESESRHESETAPASKKSQAEEAPLTGKELAGTEPASAPASTTPPSAGRAPSAEASAEAPAAAPAAAEEEKPNDRKKPDGIQTAGALQEEDGGEKAGPSSDSGEQPAAGAVLADLKRQKEDKELQKKIKQDPFLQKAARLSGGVLEKPPSKAL